MSIYAAPIEVVNTALARMGIRAIQDFSDDTKPAKVASEIYEGMVRKFLSYHRWSFAIREDTLVYQGVTEGKYTAVFALPSDALSVVNVTLDGRLIEYRKQGPKILCNEHGSATLRALVSYRALEGEWSDDFADAVVMHLRAAFMSALRDDVAAEAELMQQAQYMMTAAMVRDRRQSPPEKMLQVNGGRLHAARRGMV